MGKYLGQHFLINRDKLKKIADALDLETDDVVIEIGPGHGELTDKLVNWLNSELGKRKLILIEKDKFLAESLRKKYSQNKKIEVVEGDVLRILSGLINKLTSKPINYKIVGNIPYYITGKLLRIVSESKPKPKLVVLTLQREVAQRICAKPPKMNLLAAAVQLWAKPNIIGSVPKKDFRPEPKVDSAIITLSPIPPRENAEVASYYEFVKIIFKQPRKTILNNLLSICVNRKEKTGKCREEMLKHLAKIAVLPTDRPQNLDIEKLLELSTFLRRF